MRQDVDRFQVAFHPPAQEATATRHSSLGLLRRSRLQRRRDAQRVSSNALAEDEMLRRGSSKIPEEPRLCSRGVPTCHALRGQKPVCVGVLKNAARGVLAVWPCSRTPPYAPRPSGCGLPFGKAQDKPFERPQDGTGRTFLNTPLCFSGKP